MNKKITLLVACSLLIIVLIVPLQSQFSVVGVLPDHGTTSVDTAGTFSITFNAPLDTTARFSHPGDFFINLYFYPDSLVGEPDSIRLSPDLQTVHVHNLHLEENTDYLFVVVNAVNQSGDSLSNPYSVYVTTASTLSGYTVSGAIQHPFHEPQGTFVFLFDQNPFSSEGGAYATNGKVVSSAGGDFVIDYVKPGTYWPAAIDGFYVDGENEIDFDNHTVLGLYDFDGDNSPDSIVVPPAASNIDFPLYEVYPVTARENYTAIESIAGEWSPDAVPVMLSGDVDPGGTSLFWNFAFYSSSLSEFRYYFVMGDYIVNTGPMGSPPDTVSLPENWLDSDSIMTAAEANGGSDFRLSHQDVQVYATLSHQQHFGSDSTGQIPDIDNRNFRLEERTSPYEIPERENDTSGLLAIEYPAIWRVEYFCDTTHFSVMLDAVSGEVLTAPTTAKVAEQKAYAVAQDWAADVELWAVFGDWESVDAAGKTEWWNCIYYSPSVDSFHHIAVWGRLPMFEGPLEWAPTDSGTVSGEWMDSDQALSLAEAAGGADYRSGNQDVMVDATLGKWWHGDDPSVTVWTISYYSSSSQSWEISLDAQDGTLLTAIPDFRKLTVPAGFRLLPNYPNPFNPETVLQFSIPYPVRVKLDIYNMLGQKVTTLVDHKLPAGLHQFVWRPHGLSSGIYLVIFSSPGFQAERKILLMK